MNNEDIQKIKKNIVAIGRLLWEKELATGLNGNISVRVDDEHLLITANKACLGLLHDADILLMRLDGKLLDEGKVTTESLLHTAIYQNHSHVKAVLHTHTTYTNAYFLEHDSLTSRIFESQLFLGEVKAIEQHSPSVTDTGPVVEAIKSNHVLVLQNHGVVAVGEDLFDCFLLIQCLEETVKIDVISRLFQKEGASIARPQAKKKGVKKTKVKKNFGLFSKEQIDAIVKIVNKDTQFKELGAKTGMVMELAVQLDETGQVYSFQFENGKISSVGNNADAEFLITAPAEVWRQVFNRQLDPFVATTQKKMNLRGDYARISKWYAPCNRIFDLWTQVPID